MILTTQPNIYYTCNECTHRPIYSNGYTLKSNAKKNLEKLNDS